jgi:hypothetical protein
MASTKKHLALRKLYRRQEEIDDQVMQSARNLCGTVPTTAAGLIALLQYVEKPGEETTAKLWTARPSRRLSAHGNLRPGFPCYFVLVTTARERSTLRSLPQSSNLVGRWLGATLAGEFVLPPVRAPLIDTWLAREQFA